LQKSKKEFYWLVPKINLGKQERLVHSHIRRLKACELCVEMHKPVVTGEPVASEILLVGQAPGDKEPVLGRPFAWTAGKTLFKWFEESCGMTESQFRSSVYMAAVCRCFPGKKSTGGDRVPSDVEIANCSTWLRREIEILQPKLIIPVGKLAIQQFLQPSKLDDIIGSQKRIRIYNVETDLIPLPHPSGASPWHRMEPGKTLLKKALKQIAGHSAMKRILEKFQHQAP
jgi:uracil-DNA glycosylase